VVPERIRPVLERTAALAERFSAAGHRLYLVGGSVRDAIVGRPGAAPADGSARVSEAVVAEAMPPDIDCTTDARPEEIERLLAGWASAIWTQGKRFGTIAAQHDGVRFEITTHRAEHYDPTSRKPDVAFGSDVVVDLSRRDFTINAMALRLDTLELIDPYGGLEDLARRRLMTPAAPARSFLDDPLRMLRAARFLAGYELEADPTLTAAVTEHAERIEIVSPERIRDELDKLLVLPSPAAGLWFLVSTGLARCFLPELPALELEQDPVQRHKDVLAHTIAVVDKTQPDKILRLAALLHDIGKPKTRSYGPDGVHFHHHDVVGARLARDRLRVLRYPEDEIADVARLVELHLRFHTYEMGWTDAALRRYARDAGPLLWRLNELTRCDCTTRSVDKARALAARIDQFEVRFAELTARESLEAMRPEIDGVAVMEELGITPGPLVGQALDYLLEVRLNQGPVGNERIRAMLHEWWDEHRPTT
jgi:poly(A) polymerase